MNIEILERFRPFSHMAGATCWVPFTSFSIQVFPSLIKIYPIGNPIEEGRLFLNVKGPVKDFTVVQDLEKGEIKVFGHASNGYFRYTVSSSKDLTHLIFSEEKAPQNLILSNSNEELVQFSPQNNTFKMPNERLFLGSHKAQDWELTAKRLDPRDIFPVWHRLGLMVDQECEEEELSLLHSCQKVIESGKREAILASFQELFLAGFYSLMMPRAFDEQFQGFFYPPIVKGSPLKLLQKGSSLIRDLFVSLKGEALQLLPALPPGLVTGKLCGFSLTPYGTLDMEWSKGEPRRVVFKPKTAGSLQLFFPKGVKRARMRLNPKAKGYRVESGTALHFEESKSIFFDRFEH